MISEDIDSDEMLVKQQGNYFRGDEVTFQ